MKTLGEILRAARVERGWTLRRVESESGVSNGYVSLIETGNVKSPAPRYLKALADAYGLDFTALMTLAGHPSGPTAAAGSAPGSASDSAADSGEAIMMSSATSEIAGRSVPSASLGIGGETVDGREVRDGAEDDDAEQEEFDTPRSALDVTRAANLIARGAHRQWRPAAALGAASTRGRRHDEGRLGNAAFAIARASDREGRGSTPKPADGPDHELNALERLVREDLDGLTLEEIGHVRAFVAGLRAARTVRAAPPRD